MDVCQNAKRTAREFFLSPAVAPPDYLRQLVGDSVACRALALPEVQRANVVALYHPLPDEVPTDGLLARLSCSPVTILFPAWRAGQWVFSRWERRAPLFPSRFRIAAPVGNEWQGQPGDRFVCFVPLVGWTLRGLRLGRGGGVYDRLLAQVAHGVDLCVVGLGFEAQRIAGVVPDAWDVCMDLVVTERRVVRISGEESINRFEKF